MVGDNQRLRVCTKVLFLIYVGAVLFLCFFNFSLEGIEIPKSFLGIGFDKYCHFLMFLPYPLVGWMTYLVSRHLGKYPQFSISMTFVTGLLFAVATELAQKYLIAGRTGDFKDFLADVCGIVVGTIFIKIFGKKILKHI